MKYDRIKSLRLDSDYSQQEIADFLQLTRSAYSNYENGIRDIPLDVMAKIAAFHHTSVDYLMGLTDEKEPYPSSEG